MQYIYNPPLHDVFESNLGLTSNFTLELSYHSILYVTVKGNGVNERKIALNNQQSINLKIQ